MTQSLDYLVQQFSGTASVSHISISLGVLLPTLRKASEAPALGVQKSLRVRSLQNPFIGIQEHRNSGSIQEGIERKPKISNVQKRAWRCLV